MINRDFHRRSNISLAHEGHRRFLMYHLDEPSIFATVVSRERIISRAQGVPMQKPKRTRKTATVSQYWPKALC